MMPLFDMFMNAQNGAAAAQMARQFGLSQTQVADAIAALMPAFSTGLKRNAADPMGIGNFMQALAGGNHARYFEDMTKAFTPAGVEEGNGILGHLFGSKDVSRAVAAQAAQATGIGQEILKQMLPVIASTMMGGLQKQSTGQMGVDSDKPLVRMMQLLTRQQGEWAEELGLKEKTGKPVENPFVKAFEQMFRGAMPGQMGAGFNPINPMDNPFGRAFTDMMKGSLGQKSEPQPEPEPEPAPEPETKNPYAALFGEMFEAGRKTQAQYQRSMEQIFDDYLKGMKRQQK